MPKLEEYKVPMIVETSSSGKITTSGNPYVFRISPTSAMEAKAFQPLVKNMGIKKASFLYTNNDFGIGSADEYSKMLKDNGVDSRRHGDDGSGGDRFLRATCENQGIRAATRCSSPPRSSN